MREIASAYASSVAGVSALLFFFFFFVGVALWLYRPGAKKKYEEDARIPLRNEENGRA